MFSNDDLIFAYTRRQAIEDGVLIDVTEAARRAGLLIPVAVTAGAWGECVAAPADADPESKLNDIGRLDAVLWALRRTIETTGGGQSTLGFIAYLRKRVGEELAAYRLKAVCGPDDDGSPCITVMLPNED